jgi:hypothetical protein
MINDLQGGGVQALLENRIFTDSTLEKAKADFQTPYLIPARTI